MKRISTLAICLLLAGIATAWSESDRTVVKYHGKGMLPVPCLSSGDQIGVMFDIRANDFPIEITEIEIAWASMFGVHGATMQDAIRIHEGEIPDSMPPIFEWAQPELQDGVLNAFNVDSLPGAVIIPSGRFVVTLGLADAPNGSAYRPTAVQDGFNRRPGHNLLFTPGHGWKDALDHGLKGNWLINVTYRSLNGVVAHAEPGYFSLDSIPWLDSDTTTVYITNAGTDTLQITGIAGGLESYVSFDSTATDHSVAPGDSTELTIMVNATTFATYDARIRVYSNAKNSPNTVTIHYSPSIPAAVRETPPGLEIVSIVPNPFNPITTIYFEMPLTGLLDADLFDVRGAHVRTLAHQQARPAGPHTLTWDGTSDVGTTAASGVYYLRLATGRHRQTARLVLLK